MTDEELDQMELLWGRRVSVKRIAYTLGYSTSTITQNARKHRDRFPSRKNCSTSASDKELWVARILAERATVKQAADALRVNAATVRKWVCDARVHR